MSFMFPNPDAWGDAFLMPDVRDIDLFIIPDSVQGLFGAGVTRLLR